MKVDINICTKDRFSELIALLQSLRTQTFQDWDIQIVDGSQPHPIQTNYIIMGLVNRLKLEGHKVTIAREEVPGVCAVRNQCMKLGSNPLICRIDDDSICEPDYLERLHKVIYQNKDIGAVGGVVPAFGMAVPVRNSNLYNKLSQIKVDADGNITEIGDDLWMLYEPSNVIEADHLRSSFMFWREAAEKVGGFDTAYGLTGFREESDFSVKLKMAGYKLFADVGAVCWHLNCSSGGVRAPNYAERVKIGDELFKKRIKEWVTKEKLKL